MYKKILVVGTIILFIGAVALPGISGDNGVNTISSDEEICLSSLNSDLVAWWSFDEGTGTTANDYSSNGNTGIIYGGAWTIGIAEYGLALDGYNDYVKVFDSSSLDITQEITLSAWVILESISDEPFIIYKRGNGDDADEIYKLGVPISGMAQLKINSDPVVGGNILLSSWHHVVGTFDGNTKIIYLDGVNVADETQIATIQTSSRHLYIGADKDEYGMNQFLDGIVDEVRIYSRALTDVEVEYLFNNPGNQPPDKPSKPSGQSSGKPGEDYIYSTISNEPEGGQIYYQWSWGDNTFSPWLGPYNTGLMASASHNWTDKGIYEVKVKARDNYFITAESDWSEPLSVTMPRSKVSYNVAFYRFLEQFPLLQKILDFRTI